MSAVEKTPGRLSKKEIGTRNRLRHILTPLFNASEIRLPKYSGLQEAIRQLKAGKGLVLFADHHDRMDPYVVMETMCQLDPEFASALMVTPIGDHQKDFLGIPLAPLAKGAGLFIKPIVTQGSIDKYKKRIEANPKLSDEERSTLISQIPRKNTGIGAFSDTSKRIIREGGVVYVPTQPERAELLEISDEKPLANLAGSMRRSKMELDSVGILFIGILEDNIEDYSKKGGLNAGRRHTLTVGPFYTFKSALALAGDVRDLDEWAIVNILPNLVLHEYLSPELREKIASASYLPKGY